MDFSTFAKEVYQTAAAHGWHEQKRPAYEVIALIHSEWSEALEEARAGRPLVWHACGMIKEHPVCDTGAEDGKNCPFYRKGALCGVRSPKPEGIAVELIDGCLRILDWLGETGEPFEIDYAYANPLPLPALVAMLHGFTSSALDETAQWIDAAWLEEAMDAALSWIAAQGLNPEEILIRKHAYNQRRDYRHGGKKF